MARRRPVTPCRPIKAPNFLAIASVMFNLLPLALVCSPSLPDRRLAAVLPPLAVPLWLRLFQSQALDLPLLHDLQTLQLGQRHLAVNCGRPACNSNLKNHLTPPSAALWFATSLLDGALMCWCCLQLFWPTQPRPSAGPAVRVSLW